ncbi:unnamed protein product [Brachionus calyciflorus]|uniref:Cadherin domain-containing protein n=1 Tax=Brachionus calyciflorus TaxID=104777 RepID=A0A813ZBC1_9BILA|nr:unnamed protein product [Brachionus calyciflorus]
MIKKKLCIFTVLVILSITNSMYSPLQSEHKFLYVKPKRIECDDINLQDSDSQSAVSDQYILANLSSCLLKKYKENQFNSFSIHSKNPIIQSIFEEYFTFDEQQGLLKLIKYIDRESLCTRIEFKTKLKSKIRKNIKRLNEDELIFKSSFAALDNFVNCDCKINKCEIYFEFVAFKEADLDNRIKKNKKFNQYSKWNSHVHRYIGLNVIINDINDNRPKFRKNFLYLNITEHRGERQNLKQDIYNGNGKQTYCNVINKVNQEFEENEKIQIQKAFDLDSPDNSQIVYKLILLSNQDFNLITKLEFEFSQNEKFFESNLKYLIEKFEQNCFNHFELIDNNNFNDDFGLKINTFLDREQQDVYNFVLIALEKNYYQSDLIHNRNYMLIRLKINDLNDNQPKFDQSKYSFSINETTEIKDYYENLNFNDSESVNFSLFLNQTCAYLSKKLKVFANDADFGQNSLVKYKIIQQINRKHPNYKRNLNFNLDSEFIIDENHGSIQMSFCRDLQKYKNINRDSFNELTRFLDFESYYKHVLVVEATDSSLENSLQTVVTVDVNILDLNDNKPFLVGLYNNNLNLNLTFQKVEDEVIKSKIIIYGLSELSEKGISLGQFLITDLDSPSSNMLIQGDVKDNTKFIFKKNKQQNFSSQTLSSTIQSNEIFELFLNFEPDAEQQRFYNFLIEIKDSGTVVNFSTETEVLIFIKDENDNEPKFEKSFYSFSIDEWNEFDDNQMKSLEYCFARLEALDLDVSSENQQVFYSLEEIENKHLQIKATTNNQSNFINFYIDELTGYLCVKNRSLIDRETRSKYEFTVYAKNKDSKFCSKTSVQVLVNDLNDNPPQFKQAEYNFFITEKDSNLVRSYVRPNSEKSSFTNKVYIGSVKAFDKDIIDTEIVYYLNPSDRKSYYELNTKNSDNSLLKGNNLIFEKKDNSFNQKEETFPEVDVYNCLIEDNENENTSYFYEVTSIKHGNIDTEIIDLSKKKVLKQIEDLDEIIHVDPTTGSIYLMDELIDREQILNIKFKIYAKNKRDTPWPSLNSSVPIVIEIDDINDSKPTCIGLTNNYDDTLSNNKTIDSFSLKFNDLYIKLNPNQYKMALIYAFNCIDLDSNRKNSQLTYEIENFHLKSEDGLKTNEEEPKSIVNEFLSNFKVFILNKSNGRLYLDLNPIWWNYDKNLDKFISFFNKKYLIIKFKIFDDGIIPLSNYYYLQLFICWNKSNLDLIDLCSYEDSRYKDRPVISKLLNNNAYQNYQIYEISQNNRGFEKNAISISKIHHENNKINEKFEENRIREDSTKNLNVTINEQKEKNDDQKQKLAIIILENASNSFSNFEKLTFIIVVAIHCCVKN